MSKTPTKNKTTQALVKAAVSKVKETRAAQPITPEGNRIWGRKLLIILISVFALIFVVNGIMIWFAVSTNSGMVTDNAYEEGLAYNKTLAEQAREAGLGWSVVRNVADFPVRLVYALSDDKGAPLGGAWVSTKASRPVGEGHAFELELKEFTDGTYAAENIQWPEKGQWTLETTFVYDGKSLTAIERVNVQ